jgi:cytoskeletal protein RodZ
LGGAEVSGGVGTSIGVQVGAEGEGHTTYNNGEVSVGVSGEAALLVGLDADVNVNLDLNPAISIGETVVDKTPEIANTVANETVNVANTVADTTTSAVNTVADTAKNVGNSISDGAKNIGKKLKFW